MLQAIFCCCRLPIASRSSQTLQQTMILLRSDSHRGANASPTALRTRNFKRVLYFEDCFAKHGLALEMIRFKTERARVWAHVEGSENILPIRDNGQAIEKAFIEIDIWAIILRQQTQLLYLLYTITFTTRNMDLIFTSV